VVEFDRGKKATKSFLLNMKIKLWLGEENIDFKR